MIPMARMSDKTLGVCSSCDGNTFSGKIITTQTIVMANGLPVARMNDIALSDCGHTGIIIGGAQKVFIQGLPACQLGTQFVGTYTGKVISSASNIFCE